MFGKSVWDIGVEDCWLPTDCEIDYFEWRWSSSNWILFRLKNWRNTRQKKMQVRTKKRTRKTKEKCCRMQEMAPRQIPTFGPRLWRSISSNNLCWYPQGTGSQSACSWRNSRSRSPRRNQAQAFEGCTEIGQSIHRWRTREEREGRRLLVGRQRQQGAGNYPVQGCVFHLDIRFISK